VRVDEEQDADRCDGEDGGSVDNLFGDSDDDDNDGGVFYPRSGQCSYGTPDQVPIVHGQSRVSVGRSAVECVAVECTTAQHIRATRQVCLWDSNVVVVPWVIMTGRNESSVNGMEQLQVVPMYKDDGEPVTITGVPAGGRAQLDSTLSANFCLCPFACHRSGSGRTDFTMIPVPYTFYYSGVLLSRHSKMAMIRWVMSHYVGPVTVVRDNEYGLAMEIGEPERCPHATGPDLALELGESESYPHAVGTSISRIQARAELVGATDAATILRSGGSLGTNGAAPEGASTLERNHRMSVSVTRSCTGCDFYTKPAESARFGHWWIDCMAESHGPRSRITDDTQFFE